MGIFAPSGVEISRKDAGMRPGDRQQSRMRVNSRGQCMQPCPPDFTSDLTMAWVN